jgi:NADH:ubiquinone oxidoreductase subunit C
MPFFYDLKPFDVVYVLVSYEDRRNIVKESPTPPSAHSMRRALTPASTRNFASSSPTRKQFPPEPEKSEQRNMLI